MKSVQETWELLDHYCAPLRPERTGLDSASGRVLREDALADADQPSFSRSAMDGYLVRINESASVLRVEGEVTPGMPSRMPDTGCALRIFTGSAVPDEGVSVVMQEDAERNGDRVTLQGKRGPEHIRVRGVHARRGDILVSAGSCLTPGRIALLASAGMDRPMVSPLVRVAHIVTGGELVACGKTPAEGQIRDSNSPMISALLLEAGAECIFYRRINESPEALKAAIGDVLDSGVDLLLVSGGASVGDHDHTKPVLRDAGFDLLVDRVNSRPGKPLIVATKEGLPVFGLPGNPLSHFVCFHLFVRRAIARLTGAEPPALLRMRVANAPAIQPNPRESWLPCRIQCDGSEMILQPHPWRDSSDLTALAQVQGLLRVPSEGLQQNGFGEFLPSRKFES